MSSIVVKDGNDGTVLTTVPCGPSTLAYAWAYGSSGSGDMTFVIDAEPFYHGNEITHSITKASGSGGITVEGNSFVWDRTASATVHDSISVTNRGITKNYAFDITLIK